MNIVLDGTTLNINDICAVIDGKPTISIAESAMEKMKLSRSIVERIISNKEIVYGINTGFGALAEVEIDEEELSQLQYNLIRSHACGTGELMTSWIDKGNDAYSCEFSCKRAFRCSTKIG